MRGQYDDDDDQDEVKKELVIPKYILLYQDMEVEIKHDMLQEDKDDLHEREEEEKKAEENPEESGEEKKALKPIDRIVQYIAEITQEATEAKPISDKELAEKLKRRLDLDIDLIRPSVSYDDIEETGVWQVVVGKQFAASVTFDARFIYYFQLEESRKYFLVFRS